jgi:hypothetical protein
MAEKQRIANEVRIATEIQKSILSRTFPTFLERTDFEIYATTMPALEMGVIAVSCERIRGNLHGRQPFAPQGDCVNGSVSSECLERVNRLLCPTTSRECS